MVLGTNETAPLCIYGLIMQLRLPLPLNKLSAFPTCLPTSYLRRSFLQIFCLPTSFFVYQSVRLSICLSVCLIVSQPG